MVLWPTFLRKNSRAPSPMRSTTFFYMSGLENAENLGLVSHVLCDGLRRLENLYGALGVVEKLRRDLEVGDQFRAPGSFRCERFAEKPRAFVGVYGRIDDVSPESSEKGRREKYP